MKKQTVRIENRDGELVIFILGSLDESLDLNQLGPIDPSVKRVTFDFEQLERLNSIGFRNWIVWLRQQKDKIFAFRNCPPPFIRLIAVSEGMLPRGSMIESVQLPLVCPLCGHTESQLMQSGRDYSLSTADSKARLTIPNTGDCPKCEAGLEVDVILETYFSFLK
jgi:hypothetical protein